MTAAGIPALLEPIQERLDAATPGPWELLGGAEWISPIGITAAPDDGGVGPKDAEFIAHAPTDTARLLAAVKAVDSILSQAITMISADPDVSEYERGFDDSARGLSAKLRSAVEAALGEA